MIQSKIRTYSELMELPSYIERFRYLKLNGRIADETFGFDRYVNQYFYNSKEWRSVRREVILRDNGCDLADPDFEIHSKIIIHHLNPIRLEDIYKRNEDIMNPEYLITTTQRTHNAIHYGDESILLIGPTIRTPGDTCPWK